MQQIVRNHSLSETCGSFVHASPPSLVKSSIPPPNTPTAPWCSLEGPPLRKRSTESKTTHPHTGCIVHRLLKAAAAWRRMRCKTRLRVSNSVAARCREFQAELRAVWTPTRGSGWRGEKNLYKCAARDRGASWLTCFSWFG